MITLYDIFNQWTRKTEQCFDDLESMILENNISPKGINDVLIPIERTAIEYCVFHNLQMATHKLLILGANEAPDGNSVLKHILNDHFFLKKSLEQKHIHPKNHDFYPSLLQRTVSLNNIITTQLLIQYGDDVNDWNKKNKEKDISKIDLIDLHPLAIASNNLSMTKLLLSKGAHPDNGWHEASKQNIVMIKVIENNNSLIFKEYMNFNPSLDNLLLPIINKSNQTNNIDILNIALDNDILNFEGNNKGLLKYLNKHLIDKLNLK